MKAGDKIVCIELSYVYSVTKYKIYTIIRNPKSWYNTVGIINDDHLFTIPDWQLFISYNQYRKQKLQKINENR